MPLVKLYTLPLPDGLAPAQVLVALAEAIAPILNVRADQVLAVHVPIAAGSYVKGAVAAAHHHADSHPPVVEIGAFVGRTPEQIALAVTAAANVVTAQLGLDAGNAFVYYCELQRGQVFTGGVVRQ